MKTYISAAVLTLCLVLIACSDDVPAPASVVDAGSDAADVGLPDSAETTADEGATYAWCEGSTRQTYDPVVGETISSFPDNFYTRDDDTPTGLRVDLTPERAPWLIEVPELIGNTLHEMDVLTGFGCNTPVLLRFSAALGELPSGAEASVSSDALMLLDLGDDTPVRVPFEAVLIDEGKDIRVEPLRPLRPKTLHALVVTTELAAADGDCISPSPTMRALLTGVTDEPQLERLVPAYTRLLELTALDPADVSAAVVFTTNGELDLLLEIAADIRGRTYEWTADAECHDEASFRTCISAFEPLDYRDDRVPRDAIPGDAWSVPVTIWLPLDGEPPYPTIISAHGINADRNHGRAIASRFAPLGFAVVGNDALEHGEHPTNDPDDGTLDAMRFLGLDLTVPMIDGLALQGNFNQSTLDRLQLVELIHNEPDVDGDGVDDLDGSRLAYFGISLGGMMGGSMLALSDSIDAGVLTVAGGGLLSFVTANSTVAPLKPLIIQMVGTEADFDRLLLVAESIVDPADPSTFAPYILRDRLVESAAPHVLFNVSTNDGTVPVPTGKALARSLDIPHVGEVRDPIELIPVEDTTPVAGNLADGTVTAGFFQFDRVSSGDGVVASDHDNTPFSAEGTEQTTHFLGTWIDLGIPEIVDPYVTLGTAELEQ